jgi:biotin carboxyl carrier protein
MLHLTINGQKTHKAQFVDGSWSLDNQPTDFSIKPGPDGLLSVMLNGVSYTAIVEGIDAKAKTVKLRIDGVPYTVGVEEELDRLLKSMGLDAAAMQKAEPVRAPMPGMILRILVEPGQVLQKGDGLIVLEAMKMENVLKATAPATVKAVRVQEKTAVEKGAVLIELE